MQFFHSLLSAIVLLALAVSCSTTSVDKEFADFAPITRSEEEKALKMFATHDLSRKSAFDGRQFRYREANLRRSFPKKAYGDHPYFKLRKTGDFSDKKAPDRKEARQGSMVAPQQRKKGSWLKRVFSKKTAKQSEMMIPRRNYRLPDAPRRWERRSPDEAKNYPVEIMEDHNERKRISRGNLEGLLNSE